MLKFEDIQKVMEEESVTVSDGESFRENFESFGIDFEDVGKATKSIMGKRDAAIFITGFYTALLLASKHWEYRTPPEND